MKLRKNVNINTLTARLLELSEQAGNIRKDFMSAMATFDSAKFGVVEMDLKIDEEIARFRATYDKVDELLRSL